MGKPIRYFVLGDSYSIGEGIMEENAFPTLLVKHLQSVGMQIELAGNFARSGSNSADLLDYQLPKLEYAKPDFVTLLVGANDAVQGYQPEVFRERLEKIIVEVQKLLSKPDRLLLITIPDFTVTQVGQNLFHNPNEIIAFNNIINAAGVKYHLPVVDIYPLSREMGQNSDLVARDGLHPSEIAYKRWEEVIFPVALEMLKEK